MKKPGAKLPAALQRIAGKRAGGCLPSAGRTGRSARHIQSASSTQTLAYSPPLLLRHWLPRSRIACPADNEEAMAAVAAVDAAAAALPPFDDDAIVFMPEGQYAGGRAPDNPPNHGKKVGPSPAS